MKTFKTPKGTELPLINLQGKEYLQVAHRLVWFREEHPDWSIITEIKEGCVEASISNQGFVLATAHKSIGTKRYPLESAETGAIGRALALCGYGTSFCGDELDEKDEIADAPIAHKHHEQHVEKPKESNWVGGPSEAQLKRLYAISKRFNWAPEDVKAYLGSMGLASSKELNQMQYKKLCDNIEAYPKGVMDDGQDTGSS